MRILPATPGRALQGLAAAWVLCLAAAPAFADPGETTDPLMRLLAEKGLLAELAPGADPEASNPPKASLLREMHDRASDLTVAAMDLIGVRYRRGGTSAATGFDCSGFTRHVFEIILGLVLPRRAD